MNYIQHVTSKLEAMNANLTPGHVYRIMDGLFGIVVYRRVGSTKTEIMCRVIDVDTVREACAILNSEFAGKFTPADSDTELWGKTLTATQDMTILTTVAPIWD